MADSRHTPAQGATEAPPTEARSVLAQLPQTPAGTVVAVGHNNHGQRSVTGWRDMVSVAAGEYHTVGLRADGTVVAVGRNGNGQCNVSGWTGIRVPQRG